MATSVRLGQSLMHHFIILDVNTGWTKTRLQVLCAPKWCSFKCNSQIDIYIYFHTTKDNGNCLHDITIECHHIKVQGQFPWINLGLRAFAQRAKWCTQSSPLVGFEIRLHKVFKRILTFKSSVFCIWYSDCLVCMWILWRSCLFEVRIFVIHRERWLTELSITWNTLWTM